VTIKKGNKAPADGVLVPELNYRNYRSLEELQPELNKIIYGKADLPLCSEPSLWESPLLWGAIGVIVGGFTIAKVIK